MSAFSIDQLVFYEYGIHKQTEQKVTIVKCLKYIMDICIYIKMILKNKVKLRTRWIYISSPKRDQNTEELYMSI